MEQNKPLFVNSINAGLTYSLQVICYLVFAFVYAIVVEVLKISTSDPLYYYLNFLVSPVAIFLCLTVMNRVRKVPFKKIAPLKCHPKFIAIAILLAFGVLFSLSWVNGIVLEVLKLFGYTPNETLTGLEDLIGGLDVGSLIIMLVFVAVLPAVMEECLFRGAILNCLKEDFGSVKTIFLVGFLFSLFHGSPEQTVYQFIVGCLFAFLAVRSGSVLPTIVMHFINNAFIILATYFNMQQSPILIILSVCALIGGFVWLILDKTPFSNSQKGAEKPFFLAGAVGISVMAVLWASALFM